MKRRDALHLLGGLPFIATVGAESSTPWSRAQDMPLSVQEIYPVAHKGEVVVAGGIASRLKVPYFTDRCIAYRPKTNQWRDLAPLPETRHHAALVSTGDRLFQVGGFNGSYQRVWRMRNSIFELQNNQWTETGRLPQSQAEGVLTYGPDHCVHLVSGQTPRGEANKQRSDHHEIKHHWSWDTTSKTWHSAAPIPTARNSATGGWVGSKLIIAGGRTGAGNLATNEIYDLKSDSWYVARPMPLPQAGTASVTVDNGLIVFGGEIFSPKADVFKQVWHYHLQRDEWTALPHLPTPRHGLGAVQIAQKVYVVGGATRPSGSGTSSANEILDLGTLDFS